MAEWKKVIVSGSNANLANLQVDSLSSGLVTGNAGNLTTTTINGSGDIVATTGATGVIIGALADSHFTGSFTGSFVGDGSALTGVSGEFPTVELAGTAFDDVDFFVNDGASKLVSGSQIQDYVYAGVSGDITIDNAGAATIATSLGTLNTNNFTGSFTGSFTGDGSGLTGLATTLTVDSDGGGTTTVDLQTQQLDIAGGTNITTATTTQTVTVNLDSTITGDITFSGDQVTINNDLVVQGTASFQNTENLLVADQFILLNSGSTSTGPGGIVIQQATQDIGETFAWSSTDTRWGVTGSFSADATTFDPDAYVSVVVEGTDDNPNTSTAFNTTKYNKSGNIYIDTDSTEIWIYA